MPENHRLKGCLDQIDLGFVEREATPQLLMKLSIQLHLAGLLLSNTVSILEIFGVERARSTVHNWVHKADLQPEPGRSPDHVAVGGTMIQLNNEQYWLYAAVDPGTNELLHTTLEPTRTNVIPRSFLADLREKHDADTAVFLIDGAPTQKDACQRHGLRFQYEKHGNRNAVEHVFRDINDERLVLKLFQQCRIRHRQRVAQIVHFRMEPANLNLPRYGPDEANSNDWASKRCQIEGAIPN